MVKSHWPTVAAIAVLAALVVTVNHEAVGHGGVCLAIGGRVTLLTSSMFRCDVPSGLLDLGGPLTSLAIGLVAGVLSSLTGRRRPALTLFLVLIAGFAAFWEATYLVKAMAMRSGDLYFAMLYLVGEPTQAFRAVCVVTGLALYALAIVLVGRGLGALAGAAEGRRLARIAWVAATVATVGAALFYRDGLGPNLRDTFLEIGAASLPLLVVPRGPVAATGPLATIGRNWVVIGVAAVALAAFTATIGRGIGGA